MSTYGALAVQPPIVVLICIFGAAAVVCMGMAVQKLYGSKGDPGEKSFNQRSNDQDQYMAELRQKYVDDMYRDNRGGRRGPPAYPNNGTPM